MQFRSSSYMLTQLKNKYCALEVFFFCLPFHKAICMINFISTFKTLWAEAALWAFRKAMKVNIFWHHSFCYTFSHAWERTGLKTSRTKGLGVMKQPHKLQSCLSFSEHINSVFGDL